MQAFLEQKLNLFLCEECIRLFLITPFPMPNTFPDDCETTPCATTTTTHNGKPKTTCNLCLGIFGRDFIDTVVERIQQSFHVYGGLDCNVLTKESPTISVPNHLVIRAQCVLLAVEKENMDGISIRKRLSSYDIYTQIKETVRLHVRARLKGCSTQKTYPSFEDLDPSIRQILMKEESGFMNCHIIIHATSNVALPTHIFSMPSLSSKTKRKRFRGNDPTNKQGGDARTNADLKIKKEMETLFHETCCKIAKDSLHASLLEKNTIMDALDSNLREDDKRIQLAEWITSSSPVQLALHDQSSSLCTVHVAAWRNAIYVKGRYTKARRDCSQTPFFVANTSIDENDNNVTKKEMVRLGITSVEEEICPIVASIACGGISTQNNLGKDLQGSGSTIVYGMAKFHASGREDMDVRMILPEEVLEAERTSLETGQAVKETGSGRPFVLEIIDAHTLPSPQSLHQAVLNINHVKSINDIVTLAKTIGSGAWVVENDRMHVQYGLNPNGVGISGLDFCPSSSYRNLQSETEDKVKFYGCLCWCEKEIKSQQQLDDLLHTAVYPLEIHQATPLRVLHRRSTAVRIRHVLSLKSRRIDNHWFRLSLSTSAGTYVKEFCHGDCGRTVPSISSLLGCKTDIVELDCEGIATC
jgi:tRNA U54 and U55 pseudouridine synthase Pus10